MLYLDADMCLNSQLIQECVQKCSYSEIGALYIPEKIIGEGFWIKVRDFERSFYNGTVVDAVRFIRKDLFLEVQGFDETLVGPEDWDFDKKIRKIVRTDITTSPLYHNEGRFCTRRYIKKKSYYCGGIKRYLEKWGSNDLEAMKQVGLQYRFFGIFTESGKWKRLVRHPLLTLGLYILRIGVALEYFVQTR